jgi:hypothetical protein
MELGRRRVVAGQEDTIIEVALSLAEADTRTASEPVDRQQSP